MQKYRPEIDGLRAIAVIPVVLFHAGFSFFRGGFVGVDVFFVISGYLITSIIMSDMAEDRFSVSRFYERRIRRIFPALFAVIIFCGVVGWFILEPDDLKRLGSSIVATSLFSSNILFFSQSGYFDTPVMQKPLLHTWSLAVEEQFYVIFPLYLLLLSRYFPTRVKVLTFALCAASFGLSAGTVYFYPEATFFLAPMRAWELLLGSLLALGVFPASANKVWSEAAVAVGILLIAVPVFAYSATTPFPGPTALPPTLGAALIIWAGGGAASSFLFDSRPLVYVGKASYSLYLWHFPLFAFASYISIQGLTTFQDIGLVAISFGLAAISLRFVEEPFRKKMNFQSRRGLLAGGVATIIVFSVIGLTTRQEGGFPTRFSDDDRLILAGQNDRAPLFETCAATSTASIRSGKWCKIGLVSAKTPSFLAWGDSHAGAISPAIDEAARRNGQSGLFLYRGGCPPLLGIKIIPSSWQLICSGYADAFVDYAARRPDIKKIILIARWGFWSSGTPYPHEIFKSAFITDSFSHDSSIDENGRVYQRGMERLVKALLAAGKQVWIVGPVPEIGYDVPRTFFMQARGFSRSIDVRQTRKEFDDRQAVVLKDFSDLQKKYGVSVIYPHEALCDRVICKVVANGKFLYFDDDHLSNFGAISVARLFSPVFQIR